jgi:hypothetical protein
MKRRRQVFLLVITTALAVSSVSALEGNREIPARLLPVPDTVSPASSATAVLEHPSKVSGRVESICAAARRGDIKEASSPSRANRCQGRTNDHWWGAGIYHYAPRGCGG